jgi:hypothetical protein
MHVTPPSTLSHSRGFSNFNGRPYSNGPSQFGSPTDSRWYHSSNSPSQGPEDYQEAYEHYSPGYEEHAPPYASGDLTYADCQGPKTSPGRVHVETNSSVQFRMQHGYPEQAAHQRQPFPHSVSSPYIHSAMLSPPRAPSPASLSNNAATEPVPVYPALQRAPSHAPMKRPGKRRSSMNQSPVPPERYARGHVRHVSGGPPQSPGGLGFALPDEEGSTPSLVKLPLDHDTLVPGQNLSLQTTSLPLANVRHGRESHRRQSSNLHPYVCSIVSLLWDKY